MNVSLTSIVPVLLSGTRAQADDPRPEAISFGANGRNVVLSGEASAHAIRPHAQDFSE